MSTDRLRQKSDLHFKLGILFGPLLRLIENPDLYDDQERAETLARYFAEYMQLVVEFEKFGIGQTGHRYEIEISRFRSALQLVLNRLSRGEEFAEVIRSTLATARAAIDSVPVPRTSVIMEAGSPFTTYLKLRDLCEADATRALTWLDPFMGASHFRRYLAGVRPGVPVTLVTSEPKPNAGRRDKARWDEFLDASRLYAQELGAPAYRLVVQPSLHDRWVVFDDKRIYALGGSAKDAGDKDYFTITGVEASPENLRKIRDNIDTGAEWFGPATPSHL